MNGAQDLGGMMGFGPVAPEADEPLFHAPWEKRALAVTVACGALGAWTIDESRHARETIPPPRYLSLSYYEIWIEALQKLLARHGFVGADEMASGRMLAPAPATRRPVPDAAAMAAGLARGSPCERAAPGPARFAAGDRVRTVTINPTGHTRLPRYVRGKAGTIERVHGAHVFPDSNAHGGGENPQWLYTVVFEARDLWGREADPTLSVSADCWESYLEPA
jgi:nitrile hydratase subunit beta